MWFLCGDLHLTDRSQDAYRFGIFDWIAKQQDKRPVLATFLAGDITDSKDRHSATLVNKIVNGLMKLKPPIYILMGNHDYRDNKTPFFDFLNNIDGLHFITKPTVVDAGRKMLMVPHVRTQDELDAMVHCDDEPDSVLVHNTFDGAIAESGVRLTGLSASPIELLQPPLGVYAGDVHKPQTQGMVTYIGCPYQVRFGDNFEPRCIHINKSGVESYPWFEAPRKWSLAVRDADNLLKNDALLPHDQIKLTIEVSREEAVEWKQIRQRVIAACKKLQLDVYGIKLEVKTTERRERRVVSNTGPSIMVQFCKAENISTKIRKAGEDIIECSSSTK